MTEIIIGKFQQYPNYAFLIPDDREYYGGDFFINKSGFGGAKDGDRVEGQLLEKTKGKKPEVKIIKILENISKGKKSRTDKTIEGIYSGGEGNFGFVDIEGESKGYFVYGHKRNGAVDGDKVVAEIKLYNGKEEAIVLEILPRQEEKVIVGKYRDNDKFGFVLPDDKSGDIFIPGARKNGAKEGDRVECVIIKKGGKNPEGKIKSVLS